LSRLQGLVALLLLAAVAVAASAALMHLGGDATETAAGCEPGDRGVVKAYLCVAAREAWERLIEEFERETCIKVEAVYGASGRLLAQLALAGDGDVYAPASPDYMEKAVEEGVVDPSTVRVAAYLEPAILVPHGNPANVTSVYDLARPGLRVALGDPESVAVGRYARRMLERLGLWEKVEGNVVVYAESFAQLVMLVERGAVDAAVGWSIAEKWTGGRVEAIEIPANLTLGPSPIPVAVTSFSRNPSAARLFVEYVSSPAAAWAWREAGYTPAAGGGEG